MRAVRTCATSGEGGCSVIRVQLSMAQGKQDAYNGEYFVKIVKRRRAASCTSMSDGSNTFVRGERPARNSDEYSALMAVMIAVGKEEKFLGRARRTEGKTDGQPRSAQVDGYIKQGTSLRSDVCAGARLLRSHALG